jgi:hypothetical protein
MTGIKVVRFIDPVADSTNCMFAEVQINGVIRYKVENAINTDTVCGVNVKNMGIQGTELPAIVTYTNTKTPTVTKVVPDFGPTIGGTTLVITGTNFGTVNNVVSVLIDGVECAVSAVIDT